MSGVYHFALYHSPTREAALSFGTSDREGKFFGLGLGCYSAGVGRQLDLSLVREDLGLAAAKARAFLSAV